VLATIGLIKQVGYDNSGWTTFERCCTEQIKKFHTLDAWWILVRDLAKDAGDETFRRWPTGPDDFDELIERKQFTKKSDKDAVKALYRTMSMKQLSGVQKLAFHGMPSPTLEDMTRFGRCLNICQELTSLGLGGVSMNGQCLAAMLEQLQDGSLTKLEHFALGTNNIGNEGMKALGKAISRALFANVKRLYMNNNNIGSEGVEVFAAAVAETEGNKLDTLEELRIANNKITDDGLNAFSKALNEGALSSIKLIVIGSNAYSTGAKAAFKLACKQRKIEAKSDFFHEL